MTDVIGDTSDLHARTVRFQAVHSVTGPTPTGAFKLIDASGFKQFLAGRASAKLLTETLTVRVIGPASASIAVTAHIAIIPASIERLPTTGAELMTIAGSAFCQHSLYLGSPPVPLGFPPGVAHTLIPEPVVGELPQVVYSIIVTGGAAASTCLIQLSGSVALDGVGFVETW